MQGGTFHTAFAYCFWIVSWGVHMRLSSMFKCIQRNLNKKLIKDEICVLYFSSSHTIKIG